MTTPPGNIPDPPIPPPPSDELDALLRDWHKANAARAAAGRDRLLQALAREQSPVATDNLKITVRRVKWTRFAPLAAAAVIALAAIPFLFIGNKTTPVVLASAAASNIVMAPDGGRLDAFDDRGEALGPFVLEHTDVHAAINGPFARVTVTQKYRNPHPDKIEAVYSFPLSHRSAVDRMTMTIGDRVIKGQVRERGVAREMYESAREAGRTASLLEQERPNIFTQSVANIEPGAAIDIEISYVEQLEFREGDYSLAIPTIVGPRYIPGDSASPRQGEAAAAAAIPEGYSARRGLVLLAPAEIRPLIVGGQPSIDGADLSDLSERLASATPISRKLSTASEADLASAEQPAPAAQSRFQAVYPDGSIEEGVVDARGVGEVGGRWFCIAPPPSPAPGAPFARATDQVPDAGRITPTPARPGTRTGNDLSITVDIDSADAGIVDVESPLHPITRQDVRHRPDGMLTRARVTLQRGTEIPNRDFVLKWRPIAMNVADSVFTSRTEAGEFFAVFLQPPGRVPDAGAIPRELVFVLDTSGSMSGKPIAKCREVARRIIEAMRPQDRFNVITFSGDTQVLWPEPRPATPELRAEGLAFFEQRPSGGGTEMMTAINAALKPVVAAGQTPISVRALNELPADDREVIVRIRDSELDSSGLTPDSVLTEGRIVVDVEQEPPVTIRAENLRLPRTYLRSASEHLNDPAHELALIVRGRLRTIDSERVLVAEGEATLADAPAVQPLRIVVFLTDGYVGNDLAIIDAVRASRGTTRVFAIGIGNAVNRALLEGMASAGGGAADYVLLSPDIDADPEARRRLDQEAERAAALLDRRTRTPVLTHLSAEVSPGLQVGDFEPDLAILPDVFDHAPVVLLGRFLEPGEGTLTLRGQTTSGPWSRTIALRSPAPVPAAAGAVRPVDRESDPAIVPNLWARARIDSLLAGRLTQVQLGTLGEDLRSQVVTIGETFGIMSPFTSFIAVDHQRITIDGQPRLVPIPIPLPDSTQWDGFFGADLAARAAAAADSAAAAGELTARVSELVRGTATLVGPSEPSQNAPEALAAHVNPASETPSKVTSATGGDSRAPAQAPPPPAAASAPLPGGQAPSAVRPFGESLAEPKKARDAEAGRRSLTPSAREESRNREDPSPGRGRPSQEIREFPVARPLQDQAAASTGAGAAPSPPASPESQTRAAEIYFESLANRADLSSELGVPAPDRLVATAGANFIAQNAAAGQVTAARTAQKLFLNRYPHDPLVNEAAQMVDLLPDAASAPITDDAAPKDPAAKAGADNRSAAVATSDGGDPSQAQAIIETARRLEAAAERERTLIRRLDPRLYQALPAPSVNPVAVQSLQNQMQRSRQTMTNRSQQNRARQINTQQVGGELLIAILVEKLDDATKEALRAAGLTIRTTLDESRTIVGTTTIDRLIEVALVSGVERIEPVAP